MDARACSYYFIIVVKFLTADLEIFFACKMSADGAGGKSFQRV